MYARFSGLLLTYAAFVHCVTVNVNKGSQIIAATKEEISPLIIDSKLNQIVTIYVPIVKGTKAKYYLTDPRGEERRLHIKDREKKKHKHNTEKLNNRSIKRIFSKNVKNIQNTNDTKNKLSDRKVYKEVYRNYKYSANKSNEYFIVKHVNEESKVNENLDLNSNASENQPRDNSLNEITEHNFRHKTSKRYKEKLIKRNTRLLPHNNNIEQKEYPLNDSLPSDIRTHKQKAFVYFVKENYLIDEDKEHPLHKNDFQQPKSIQPETDLEITEVNAKQNVSDNRMNQDIIIIFNEVVDVSNLKEYDDAVFKRKRKSCPNFNIGPLVEDDHGNWVLSVFYKGTSGWVELYQVITINIFEGIPAEPKVIKLKEGADYILSFSYPIEHLQSCELVSPRTASEKYYERYGQNPKYCGYIVKNISKMEEGSWCVVGVGKIVYEACSNLQVDLGDFNFNIVKEIYQK